MFVSDKIALKGHCYPMKTVLSRIFNVSFFFVNIFIPVVVLALYCVSFGFFSYHSQLNGVNYFFVEKLGLNQVSDLPALAPFLPDVDALDEVLSSLTD